MNIFLAICAAPLIIVTAFFCLELILGLRPAGAVAISPHLSGSLAVVVVPANNEAEIIGLTLPALQTAAAGIARILVVADNCTDQTAQIVEGFGVQVIRRVDPSRRGKGFALAHARDFLAQDSPDVVLVVDADCAIDGNGLAALVARARETGRPCQAVNLLRPSSQSPPMVQISTFAFLLKNLVRQRGLARISGGVHLTGTGMALPWAAFARANLETASIVEDARLGLELTMKGAPPMLIENANIWSSPTGSGGTLVQRQRWEGGFLALAASQAPRLLLEGIVTFDFRRLATALDLFVPPAALLFLLNAAAGAVLVALAALGVGSWPIVVGQALVALLAGACVLLAWWCEGRDYVQGAVLLQLPFYIVWKLPMYIRLLFRRDSAVWTRTGR